MSKVAEAGEFLPVGYEPPKSKSNYMKFQDGENEFRIMSSPILGWEYWNKTNGDNKPVRLSYTEDNMKRAALESTKNPDPKDHKSKHFWAMVVWDYATKSLMILQINQKSIQDVLRGLAQNKKWGSPVGRYDINIIKEGKELETTYTVTPSPHSDTPEEAEIAFNSTFIDLDALFYGQDPWDEDWKKKVGDTFTEVFE